MTLDFDLRLRAHPLAEWVAAAVVPPLESSPASVRCISFDPAGAQTPSTRSSPGPKTSSRPSTTSSSPSRVVHLPLSWDDPAHAERSTLHARRARRRAVVPGERGVHPPGQRLDDVDDVRDIVYDAEYLVLGLGDVYLGAPVAVPIDPRHRLVTTKYNPARTWTPQNAVGIGGIYLCIYGMEGPGGYQFVGRTVPVWPLRRERTTTPRAPWFLRFFDRIRWYPWRPTSSSTSARTRSRDGSTSNRSRLVLTRRAPPFLNEHHEVDRRLFATRREGRCRERARVDRAASSPRAEAANASPLPAIADVRSLPDGAFVVESPLHGCVARCSSPRGAASRLANVGRDGRGHEDGDRDQGADRRDRVQRVREPRARS